MPNLTADRLPLYDGDRLIKYIDEHEARELLRAREATMLHTKTRIRGLRLLPATAVNKPTPLQRSTSARWRTFHFSHDHETETNPPGVWELVPYRVLTC